MERCRLRRYNSARLRLAPFQDQPRIVSRHDDGMFLRVSHGVVSTTVKTFSEKFTRTEVMTPTKPRTPVGGGKKGVETSRLLKLCTDRFINLVWLKVERYSRPHSETGDG
jgi:hypothetical protein